MMSDAQSAKPKRPLSFFDPEHVERPTPQKPWAALALASIAMVALFTAGWEVYWRGKGLYAGDYKQSVALWAKERRKATGDATVIIGSSRIFFGVNLDVWEREAGVRPIQLALEGTSARVALADIAQDQEFRGLLIVGVTTPLYFSQVGGRRSDFVERWRNVTLADRMELALTRPLEDVFAFIDDLSRIKTQISYWDTPVREGMKPRFNPRKLETLKFDRNTHLWERVIDDPDYRAEAIAQWARGIKNNAPPPGPDGKPPAMPDQAIDAVIAESKGHVDAIRARGGDVVFVRMPFKGVYEFEYGAFPRARFFDPLAARTHSGGVNFEDYPAMQGLDIPEDSHLSAAAAEVFTAELVKVLYPEVERARAARPSGDLTCFSLS
jgi:hypothetical protein